MSSIAAPPNPFLSDSPGGWRLPPLDEILLLAGDWVIYVLANHAPTLASMLGVGSIDYGGVYAGVLSFWSWLLLSLMLIMVAAAIRGFDRALTWRIAMLYADLRYRARLLRQLAIYRRRAVKRVEPTFGAQPH